MAIYIYIYIYYIAKLIFMKSKIFYVLLFLFSGYAIVYASGGGGGGSCGKNNNCDGPGEGGQTIWRLTFIGGWVGYSAPSEIAGYCMASALGNNGGINTFPILAPQTIGSNEYLSQVIVQDLVTGEIRQQEYFPGSSSMPIYIPLNHTFRVNFTHYDHCSSCMSNLIFLNPGEGRRVIWNSIREFTAGDYAYGVTAPQPVYSGLASCN